MQTDCTTTRRCSKCGTTKPSDQFYTGHAQCKECRRARVRQTYEANRERYAAADEAYRHRPEVQQSRAVYSKEWAKANRDKKALYKQKLRELRLASEERYTKRQFRELCDRYGNICLCCGASVQLTPDHIVPLSKGGSDSIDNIQPLCMPCNRKKYLACTNFRVSRDSQMVQTSA